MCGRGQAVARGRRTDTWREETDGHVLGEGRGDTRRDGRIRRETDGYMARGQTCAGGDRQWRGGGGRIHGGRRRTDMCSARGEETDEGETDGHMP